MGEAKGGPPAQSADPRRDGAAEQDPVSGVAAIGIVANPAPGTSDARGLRRRAQGRRIVAAGWEIVARLRARKRARYRIFFIGDPKGAKLTVSATPNPTG